MDRHAFLSAASRRIEEAPDAEFGLVLVRVNHLKEISHAYGFGFGDQVIATLAQRLAQVARPDDLVGHLDGSCFAVLLAAPCGEAMLELALNRMLALFDEAVPVDGMRLRCHSHGAGVRYPAHGHDVDQLLATAEKALARARTLGQPCLPREGDRLLQPSTDFRILESLEDSIDAGELELRYQPQVAMDEGRVAGVEALLRWQSPTLGTLSPDQFIPLVELTELIIPLTRWIFQTALRDHRRMREVDPGLKLSINLSASLLTHPELHDMVGDALAIWEAPREHIVVEITETAMMHRPESSIAALHRLRSLGLKISIDDFGTGYSSLAYLARLPSDELKIDKSFVDGVLDEVHDQKIVHAVIDLAHTFDMAVVAEGIETLEQAAILRDFGCDIGQGYLYARPFVMSELIEHLAHMPGRGPVRTTPRGTGSDHPPYPRPHERALRSGPERGDSASRAAGGSPAVVKGSPSPNTEEPPMSYTLPEFLAHAVAMEDEAAERYLELADMMEAHDNTGVATVFRDMNRFSKLHGDSIRERTGDLELPRLKSWEFRWTAPPEVGDEEGFDYLMHPFHALEYARENEQRAEKYYREVAAEASDPEVVRLAAEFAAEEEEHAEALARWIEQTPRP